MKALKTYFEKRKKALGLILEKTPDSFTAETFHELRVEIKKLKALVELIAFCSKNFKAGKTFKPFKTIFKKAGKIREMQLEQTILQTQPNFQLLQKIPNRLKKEEVKKIKKFFLIINKHLTKRMKEKYRVINSLLLKIDIKKIEIYRDTTKKKINKLICKNNFKKKQIHDFRKRLKVFQYNEKIIPVQKNLDTEQDELSELLGKWHDYDTTLLHLKKIIATVKKHSSERKHLKNIKLTMSLQREMLFKKINATLSYEILG